MYSCYVALFPVIGQPTLTSNCTNIDVNPDLEIINPTNNVLEMESNSPLQCYA